MTRREDYQAPEDLSDAEADAIVVEFDALAELRAAAAARREADSRIEAAALRAHRDGASRGVIGAQLGITRQGARQRFERLTTS